MSEKRYYAHKHLMKEDKVHDKICHKFMNITETVEHMNMYYQKYTALKKENEQLKQQICYLIRELKTEMETSISRNERIRLDFAITVLESLKGDEDD